MNHKTTAADYDARGYLTAEAMRRLTATHTIYHHPPDSAEILVIGHPTQVPTAETLAKGDPAATAAALADLKRQQAEIAARLAVLEGTSAESDAESDSDTEPGTRSARARTAKLAEAPKPAEAP